MKPLGQLILGSNLGPGKDSRVFKQTSVLKIQRLMASKS